MAWQTDALAALDRLAETGLDADPRLADRYRERRADRRFQSQSLPTERPTGDAPDHVVVVVVDALRADAVEKTPAESADDSRSGAAADSESDSLGAPTPFLDSLVGGTAIAPATWTVPSVTSMLTGQYPHNHGAVRRTDDFEDSVADVIGLPPTSDETGVAGRFAGAGYDTYAGFGMLVPFLALSGRFSTHRLREDASADRVLADHLPWLEPRRDRRTLSYLHLADLHEPVAPPADYWEAHDVDASIPGIREWRYEAVTETTPAAERYREHRRRLYRAAVEYVDNRLAAYHRRISDLLSGDVALVVVGDHGEGFWERADHAARRFADSRPAYCVGHGGAPYEVLTRVPLRVSGLDASATFEAERSSSDQTPVSLVDVAPTLADAAGLDRDPEADQEADGDSLLSGVPEDRTVLVESARYGYEKKAAYARGYKLIASRGDDYAEGFSVPDGESVELPPDVESNLRDALPAFPGESDSRTSPRRENEDSPSRSVERRLADLGYR
ncbi:sulfatase-like hydrolase/transferase [Halorussus aquaticus]|uniref:Sulfatase-like hydrolase/transferase n=1 Tax=Halorussus aquaticus TaxID=2953748 RepID=A0ABD5Q011_9EURY|nr:sulfatase-like hydrolase/transferase [Halorussus aquaticus]